MFDFVMASLLQSRRAWVFSVALVLMLLVWWNWTALWWRMFPLDWKRPFLIELGRGSGRCGLATVRVSEDGIVSLHRWNVKGECWETATLTLPIDALDEVRGAIKDYRLLELRAAYSSGLADGTQWVFRVKQGERVKAVYCDNQFPDEILRFAEGLDNILSEKGVEQAAWRRVPDGEAWKHDEDLWASIR